MSQTGSHPDALAEAADRVARADQLEDDARLRLLEELHESLERELDAGEADETGR